MKKILLLALLLTIITSAQAQFPDRSTSAELYHDLEKLENTATILYMAAHPDDENTRLISYFENDLHARVGYLSLTRGDGGQNLIGTEIGNAIGVLRTQELLQARSIDGGEQFFTRAVDFGYSKSAEESFEKWGRENILRDVVWVIRKFQPDAIVTRFPPSNYAGHGHHEASAILAEEAFEAAADPNKFPEQLEWVDTWSVKRLYFNSSSWWDKELPQKAKESDEYLTVDIGAYNPLLGESYSQIAARSRSSHKSQGFGSDYPFGQKVEYLKYVMGDKANPDNGILDGIESSWKRLNASSVANSLNNITDDYDIQNPARSVSKLIDVRKEIEKLESTALVKYKLAELDNLLIKMAGISYRYTTSEQYSTSSSSVSGRLEMVSASGIETILNSLKVNEQKWDFDVKLDQNVLFSEELIIEIPENAVVSNPYWLNGLYSTIYNVDDYTHLGKPENDPSIFCEVDLTILGENLKIKIPFQFKNVDPADALILNPFYISPRLSASFAEQVLISPSVQAKEISLVVKNFGSDKYNGKIGFTLPNGWSSSPENIETTIEPGGDALLKFEIGRVSDAVQGKMKVHADHIDSELLFVQEIDYDHIPKQIIVRPAEVDLVPINMNRGKTAFIGYIEGPGDNVAKYLRAAGYTVEVINETDLKSTEALNKYDAILTGIRAFNTRPELSYANNILNEYVANGGTWVVQYNTSRGLKSDKIGPYQFELSRERVTDEHAEAIILNPEHSVMNFPNKIDPSDFDNWVQERGLYFAGEWSSEFEPIISWNDPEEAPRNGGLIIAPYQKGNFVYTGISFFRELPAGVPGAYRLIANILALGESEKKNE